MIRRTVLVLTLAVMAAAAVGSATGVLPYAHVVVAGSSMEPTYGGGDLVITQRRPFYEPGQVVAYRIPRGEHGAGTLVIHRIVAGSATGGYVLKGDNREHVDAWRPTARDVVGEAVVHVPRAGLAISFLRSPLGLGLVAGVLTLLVLAIRPRPQRVPAAPAARRAR